MEPVYQCIVPKEELDRRMERFRAEMDRRHPDWRTAVIIGSMNLYYLCGTIPDGFLVIPRDGGAVLWVRRTLERAQAESALRDIRRMESFRDAAAAGYSGTVYIETELVPLAWFERFNRHFRFDGTASLDGVMSAVRAVKSSFEVGILRRCGALHARLLEETAPGLMTEGMSETDLSGELMRALLRAGGQGISRFAMFQNDTFFGHISFGESSLADTTFNGPNGNLGMSPAVPQNGNPNRRLRPGDHVLLDVGAGLEGYNTDKTMTYTYRGTPSEETVRIHRTCLDIQRRAAEMLRPGAVPSQIYARILDGLDPAFAAGFMGYGHGRVRFLGHGVGLHVDEYPVLARGFDAPLEENMVLALEPKYGLKDVGIVGIENTFLVTPEGGECLTGTHGGLLRVD